MRSLIVMAVAVFVVTLGASSAVAQFAGPNEGAAQTVKSILDRPVDDAYVTLKGHIQSQVRHEKYWFSDSTGKILVDIDDEDFMGQRVSPRTLVQIYGEVEKDFMTNPQIDVKRIVILK